MNTTLSIQQLITNYLQDRDIAASSRVTYKYILSYFFRYLVDMKKDATNPKRTDVITYKEHLVFDCKSDYTIDLYINALKGFFIWLTEQGYYSNITQGIKNVKRVRGFRKLPLSVDQINILLHSIDRETITGKRDYAMIRLSLTAGLRVIELSRLRISNLSANEIIIHRKGSITPNQQMAICNKMHAAIEDYLIERMENETLEDHTPLFASHSLRSKTRKLLHAGEISRIIKDRLHESGINNKKITAHSLRHTTACVLHSEGMELTSIQRFMGHANISTTQLYTQFAELDKMERDKPSQMLSNLIKD
jgi:site-specific recombinase XerD